MAKSSLNPTDLKLLIALQEQPTAPYSTLAQKVGLSPQTISHRIQRLRERGHGKVKASIDSDVLNLEYLNLLLEVTSLDKLSKIEKLVEMHPYGLYHSRCFGRFNGAFLQFRIPKGSREALLVMLDRLEAAGIIRKKYEIPTIGRTIYTRPQLAFWNPEDSEWEFSWLEWTNEEVLEATPLFDENSSKDKPEKEVILLDKLDYIDMHLLRYLTIDARQKQRQITQEVNKDLHSQIPPQRINERLKYLMDHAVRDYRVFVNWNVLDIYNTVLLVCKAVPSAVDHFRKRLVENPPPFDTAFYLTPDGFMWFVRCPSSHLSGLTEILAEKVSSLSLNVLDYRHTQLYWFWPEIYDKETRGWKLSDSFMVDEPLASIGITS
ncbi:MAG: AsnC family transcriptional regulator [Candidatus Hodarchaeales archaeon]|jgi:DNA-binding Lrp family transcriptional regulator